MSDESQTTNITNERIKLSADFLSKLGVLLVVAGIVIPVWKQTYYAVALVVVGGFMVVGAYWLLGKLKADVALKAHSGVSPNGA